MIAFPSRLVVQPERWRRGRWYKPFPRLEEWRELSRRIRRAAGWRCEQCGRTRAQLRDVVPLQCAHLVAEYELWLLGLHVPRFVFDERNLVSLCAQCHESFDYWIGVNRQYAKPFQAEWLVYVATYVCPAMNGSVDRLFRPLALRRMRYLSTLISETEGWPELRPIL